MAITIANRPAALDGCWSSWTEKQNTNIIRTDMDLAGATKVRRRTTGITRIANVSRVFEAKHYDDVLRWFNVNCQQGVLPTRMKTPYMAEEVWRFTEAPEISWLETGAFAITTTIEQLPSFRGL